MPFKPREYLRLNPEGLLRSKTADGFRATLTAERVALTCRVRGGVSPVGWGALPFLVVGRPLGQLRNRAKPHATTCASLSNHVHGFLRPDFDPMSTPERHQRTFMKFMWPSGCPSCLVRSETEAPCVPAAPTASSRLNSMNCVPHLFVRQRTSRGCFLGATPCGVTRTAHRQVLCHFPSTIQPPLSATCWEYICSFYWALANPPICNDLLCRHIRNMRNGSILSMSISMLISVVCVPCAS